MMTVQRDIQVAASLESLRRALAVAARGPKLQEAQQALQRVARQVGPVQPQARPHGRHARAGANTVRRGQHAADPIDDPDRHYTEAVKSALIDAMLDHSLLDGSAGRTSG